MFYVILLFTLLSSEARKFNASSKYAISKIGSSFTALLFGDDAKIRIFVDIKLNNIKNISKISITSVPLKRDTSGGQERN